MAAKVNKIKVLAKSAEGMKLEEERLIEFALGQKKEFLQALLKEKGLAFSGTKEQIRERVANYLKDEELTIQDLVNFLDSVEGWGDQSIYIYSAPTYLINQWRKDNSSLKESIRSAGWGKIINVKRTLFLPEEPELSTITLTDRLIQFTWVEKHEWFQRTRDFDDVEGDIVLRAFRRNLERRVTRFEVDLTTGICLMTIPKISNLPTNADDGEDEKKLGKYEKIRDGFEEKLTKVLPISSFKKFSLKKTIEKLQESDEVMRRENVFETPDRSQIRLLSASSDIDTREDIRVEALRSKIPADTPGTAGNYKWLPSKGGLGREIGVKLYGLENRVAINVQCTEEEVRYVLSRIRKLGQ